jgi:hypothetical protein
MVSHLQPDVNTFSLFGKKAMVLPFGRALVAARTSASLPLNSFVERADELKPNLHVRHKDVTKSVEYGRCAFSTGSPYAPKAPAWSAEGRVTSAVRKFRLTLFCSWYYLWHVRWQASETFTNQDGFVYFKS